MDVISRINLYDEYAALVLTHSMPYSVVHDYRNIVIESHIPVAHSIMKTGVALHHIRPVEGSQRCTVSTCNWHPVIPLLFITSNPLLQRGR